MDVHNAIARWESEGGAFPQVQTPRQRFKALMLRQVLVPIDFSLESLKTLHYAKRLGERFKAQLHLVYVVTPPPTYLPQRTPLTLNFSQELAADASEAAPKTCGKVFASDAAQAVLSAQRRNCRRDQHGGARHAGGADRDCDPRLYRA